MSEYRYRLATAADADLIVSITLDAFRAYQSLPVPSSALDETLPEVEKALADGEMQAVLCLGEFDEVVGCARFRFADGLYFFRLSVPPQHQGRGIATQILNWLEQHAIENGQSRIWCRVRAELPRNIELYQRLGYQVFHREWVERGGQKIETLHMEKKTLSA